MASLTIRGIEDETKEALRVRAAQTGLSMEEFVRNMIRDAVEAPEDVTLGDLIAAHFGPEKGVDLEPHLPRREAGRDLPSFE